jgi:DNA-packaging protein gp3
MGKRKAIETPEKLLYLFNEYKDWVLNNPIKKHVFVGKDGTSDFEMRQRPLTMEGFEVHLFNMGFISDLSHYFCNLDNRYSDYVAICTHIRKEIRNEQIAGGMAGIYNPSITQRLNNLVERTENTNIEQPLFPNK